MIFIVITILAVGLYIWDFKISAMLLFFFFLTSGFQLIPEEITNIGIISKSADYAFFILLGIVVLDSLLIKNYLKTDQFIKCLMIFGTFLVFSALYSRFSLGVSWSEIIRTCRYHFFWLTYFVFRQMEKENLERLLKYLFAITVVISVLFLAQIILHKDILIEVNTSTVELFGIRIPRYYNQPYTILFCSMMAIYHNPYKGIWKMITLCIVVLALVGAFHRSWNGVFVLILIVGYSFRLSRLRRIQFLTVLITALVFGISIVGLRFLSSKTYTDMKHLATGDFANIEDIDMEVSFFDLYDASTFTYRLAHLYERNQYLLEHPQAMIVGAGLMTEDSKLTDRVFNFKIGLIDPSTYRIMQLDSPDISYSFLLMRYGYVGTILYLFIFVWLMVFFYRKRENKYGFFSFLYILLSIGVALFSSNLNNPISFVLPLISYHIIQKDESKN
jgi:hypothetical protein